MGTVLLDHLVREALADGRRPVAHFVPTEANRNMLVTLRFAGYLPVEGEADPLVLAFDPERLQPPKQGHVRVITGTD